MATLKLYDNPASIHAQYARVVLDETGIDYEKERVELPFGNLEPSYAKVSPALSVPALEIIDSKDGSLKRTLTDSRDIVIYCATVEGGERLFPREKMNEINEILDLIYRANGGKISFKAYPSRDPVFDFAVNKVMAPLRGRKIRGYISDPSLPQFKKIYEAALERHLNVFGPPGSELNELTKRANKTMTVLNEKLENGPWLLGKEHTAIDSVASIWVQWIVWVNVPSIIVTPRVLDFLERSKQRPAWKKCDPKWVVAVIRTRLYTATAILGLVTVGMSYVLANKFGDSCAAWMS